MAPAERDSCAYHEFWRKPAKGEFLTGQFKRIGKNGAEVWLEASYNPIFNWRGKVARVIKYATDITEQKLKRAEMGYRLDEILGKHHSMFADPKIQSIIAGR